MASWDDVRRTATDLPGAVEDVGPRPTAWRVGSRAFAWERVLLRDEREQLGARAPAGPALGLRVPDAGVAEALRAGRPDVYLSVPRYDGTPMLLVHVEAAPFEELDEAITESWLCRAPQRLVRAFLLPGQP